MTIPLPTVAGKEMGKQDGEIAGKINPFSFKAMLSVSCSTLTKTQAESRLRFL